MLPSSTHQLEVRARHTYWGGTGETFELGVSCPEKLVDVPLDECIRCGRSGGLRLDPETRTLIAVCEKAGGSEGIPEDELAFLLPEDVPSASETSVATIMATSVICVGSNLSLASLEELFLEKNISGAPVVNAEGHAVGMVSKTDLVRYRGAGRSTGGEGRTVREIMTPLAFCVPPNASIAKAAALMAFEGMHRLPVVNSRAEVVGIVSSLDVLRWLAKSEGYVLGGSSRKV